MAEIKDDTTIDIASDEMDSESSGNSSENDEFLKIRRQKLKMLIHTEALSDSEQIDEILEHELKADSEESNEEVFYSQTQNKPATENQLNILY